MDIMPRERCVHIVDDELTVRDALTVLLSTAAIESRSYGSAEEYLVSTQLTAPACVLLDNQLPGMSGIELLKRIVNAASPSNVIMITGFGDVPTAVLAMKAGAFDFVQKPFDPCPFDDRSYIRRQCLLPSPFIPAQSCAISSSSRSG